MKIRTIFLSFMRLATGEVFGRMATFALFIYISRNFGVEFLGIVALAQTVASYVMELSDQGLKLIGARLLARSSALAGYLVPFIMKRRAVFTAGAVLLGSLYALFGPMPEPARGCVLVFNLAVIPYAFALDWVAWGLGHFGVLSIWRSGVSILYVAIAIAAMRLTMRPIASIAGANLASAIAGACFLWLMWRLRWRRTQPTPSPATVASAVEELRPRRVMTLGVANLLNLAGVSPFVQKIVDGVIIVGAIAVYTARVRET